MSHAFSLRYFSFRFIFPIIPLPCCHHHSHRQRQLRKVNTVSFPVAYNEGFYQDVVKRKNEHLNKFAYYNGFVVGAVCTRVESVKKEGGAAGDTITTNNNNNNNNSDNVENETPQSPNNNNNSVDSSNADGGKQRLYIMTLAVLAAYRGRGIGEQLIQSVLDYCDRVNQGKETDDNTSKNGGAPRRIDEIALHVQISNEDAIRFYTKKFGFKQGEMVENYYRRIDPPHCYILSKELV